MGNSKTQKKFLLFFNLFFFCFFFCFLFCVIYFCHPNLVQPPAMYEVSSVARPPTRLFIFSNGPKKREAADRVVNCSNHAPKWKPETSGQPQRQSQCPILGGTYEWSRRRSMNEAKSSVKSRQRQRETARLTVAACVGDEPTAFPYGKRTTTCGSRRRGQKGNAV